MSRRSRPVSRLRVLPKPKPMLMPAQEQTAALVYYDPDRPVIPTLDQLLASVKRTQRAISALNAGHLDPPDERGGIRYPAEGEDGVPVRIAENESPLNLARETQLRRERARREATQARYEYASLIAEVKRREAEWRRSS